MPFVVGLSRVVQLFVDVNGLVDVDGLDMYVVLVVDVVQIFHEVANVVSANVVLARVVLACLPARQT